MVSTPGHKTLFSDDKYSFCFLSFFIDAFRLRDDFLMCKNYSFKAKNYVDRAEN